MFSWTWLIMKFGLKPNWLLGPGWVTCIWYFGKTRHTLVMSNCAPTRAHFISNNHHNPLWHEMCQSKYWSWNPGLEGVSSWPVLALFYCILIFFLGTWHDPNRASCQMQGHITPFSCNDRCPSWGHKNTRNHIIGCNRWSGVEIWLWKGGSMPRSFRHKPPDWLFPSSST